jgi:hypothetical protein
MQTCLSMTRPRVWTSWATLQTKYVSSSSRYVAHVNVLSFYFVFLFYSPNHTFTQCAKNNMVAEVKGFVPEASAYADSVPGVMVASVLAVLDTDPKQVRKRGEVS